MLYLPFKLYLSTVMPLLLYMYAVMSKPELLAMTCQICKLLRQTVNNYLWPEFLSYF